jgi:hypothetical protein
MHHVVMLTENKNFRLPMTTKNALILEKIAAIILEGFFNNSSYCAHCSKRLFFATIEHKTCVPISTPFIPTYFLGT